MLVHSYSKDTWGPVPQPSVWVLTWLMLMAPPSAVSQLPLKLFASLGSSSDLYAVQVHWTRTASSQLLQVDSFKGCAELCWLWMVPVKNICQQHLFPALLVVKFLTEHRETKSFAALNQMPLKIISSLLTPGYQKALGMNTLVTDSKSCQKSLIPCPFSLQWLTWWPLTLWFKCGSC